MVESAGHCCGVRGGGLQMEAGDRVQVGEVQFLFREQYNAAAD